MTALRVVDSGLQRPTWHLAASAALAERHRDGTTPDTLRFQDFPPCALLGRHQVLARELDEAWCAAHGVAIARRVTGGGAIVMAPGILGWELLLPAHAFPGGIGEVAARICGAVATALRGFGLDARYRPRNDVEVDGRKVSGTGGWFDGPTLLYQGTILARLDRTLLGGALRWPGDKQGPRPGAARVADLAELLGHPPDPAEIKSALARALGAALGRRLRPGGLDAPEQAAAAALETSEIGTEAFIRGETPPHGPRVLSRSCRTPGGTVEVTLRLRPGGLIERALVSGDVVATPARALPDLEAALRDVALRDAAAVAAPALAGTRLLGGAAQDIVDLLAAMADEGERQWPSVY
jgi:lipoate-protein ligase A